MTIFQTVSVFSLCFWFMPTAFAANAPAIKPTRKLARNKIHKPVAPTPVAFLITQVDALKTELTQQPLIAPQDPGTETEGAVQIESGHDKQSWLSAIYKHHLVNTSHLSEALADRLILSELIKAVMHEPESNPLPKTMGLKQFLELNSLIGKDGKITADGDQIEAALHKEFPAGFIVRPAVGIVQTETEVGLFKNSDQFIVELLKKSNSLYDPLTYKVPIRSHILDAVVSGEAVVLQENIVLSTDADKRLRSRRAAKVRLHTYEEKIVPDSVPRRWVRDTAPATADETKAAYVYAQGFLRKLPPGLLARQAWSIEVSVFDNGTFKITDLVTNRGRTIAWSGYLDQPQILQAYTKLFETEHNVQFTGLSGFLLRHGLAEYFHYWRLRIEKAPWLWHKLVALWPPWP
jgi:hypothetical protein